MGRAMGQFESRRVATVMRRVVDPILIIFGYTQRCRTRFALDQSDYVVGTTLFVDGGMTLYAGLATA
jgi:NAD(P)-dependent dehydrogenase (short-subunit alcohol dehydrogenase family)